MTLDRATLPPNVRRWLDKALPVDATLPNKIVNTQAGEMDIRGKWLPFTARTIYQAQPFAFTWKARFQVMPGVWLTAEDGHNSEAGWGGAKLWGIISTGGRTGPEVLTMQLVRNLAELPWAPQVALAVPNLTWADSSDTTFRVRGEFSGQEVSVTFELNEDDDLIRARARRHYDVPDGFVEVDWHVRFSEHQLCEGIRIPISAVATYDKPEGAWEYWRGRITSVVTDV